MQFKQKVEQHGFDLKKSRVKILQVNLGKLCNLTCSHCHVEAGPTKTKENMDRRTAEAVLRSIDVFPVETLDLTGGAPELNPNFQYLVKEARRRNIHVIDRCNLTVFYEKGQALLPNFLADQQVEVIASLPCYQRENVDKQRGRGTFDLSIRALQKLNGLGYGKPDSRLQLNLVYNPVGPHLPPAQTKLEKSYKKNLMEDFGISFNRLYTITNMPITRYAKYLQATGQLEDYTALLVNNFNPHTLEGLMCRDTLSVSWDGKLYDCDFNQMLELQMHNGHPLSIFDLEKKQLKETSILVGEHCFGCTAGSGSSCQGTVLTPDGLGSTHLQNLNNNMVDECSPNLQSINTSEDWGSSENFVTDHDN